MSKDKGLTFLEVILALALFGAAMVGFLQVFNTGIDANYRATQENNATNLARTMVAEVVTKSFVDPEDPTNTALGPNGTEAVRLDFDDVDDYHGWNAPPSYVDGTAMDGTGDTPNYADFTVSVDVKYVDYLTDGTQDDNPGVPTDYKKIIVTITAPYTKDIIAEEVKSNSEE